MIPYLDSFPFETGNQKDGMFKCLTDKQQSEELSLANWLNMEKNDEFSPSSDGWKRK